MLLPRPSVLSALLLLLLLFILLQTPGSCCDAPGHRDRGPRPRAEVRRDRHSLAQLIGRSRRGPGEAKKPGRSNQGHLSDPKHKEKFIIQLTGPLYFKPRCRKQFHRLYNNTRDCTVPKFYRRCARLLTQLAKSPRCAER
ncbi:ALK and LTK ligand 2-like [Fundulus diaphanus]